MSITKSIENLFENPAFEKPVQEFNRQLYFIKGKSVVRTDSGAYKQYTCYPEYWFYGETVAESCLQPISLDAEEQSILDQLIVSTKLMNENGFAPIALYPSKQAENEQFLVCTLENPVYLLMDGLSFAQLNEHSLASLPENLKAENNLMNRYRVSVAKDGKITELE